MYLGKIRNVLPLFAHPSYSQEFEFGDKAIVPKSLSTRLRRCVQVHPIILELQPERRGQQQVSCGILDFSAEEDVIYLPVMLIKQLGYRVVNFDRNMNRRLPKKNYGLHVIYNNQILTHLQSLTIYCEEPLSLEEIKRGLKMYSVLNIGDQLLISGARKQISLEIMEMQPRSTCLVNQDNFDIKMTHDYPIIVEQADKGIMACAEKPKGASFGIFQLPEKPDQQYRRQMILDQRHSYERMRQATGWPGTRRPTRRSRRSPPATSRETKVFEFKLPTLTSFNRSTDFYS